jgi:hypothetical protein
MTIKAVPVDIRWNPDLPVYASDAFLRSVSPEYGWLGGIDSSGALLCILPYSVIRKWSIRLVRFPVETVWLNEPATVDAERHFLNNAVAHLRSIGTDVIVPATFNTVFRTYPDGAIAAPFGSYVVDLTVEESVLWSKVHSKHRNVIRNATKRGVVVKTGIEHLETAFQLVRDSFRRSAEGLVGRLRVDSRMRYDTFRQQTLALGDQVTVFIAELDGVPQSGAVMPFSRHSAYYMHGGNVANPLTGSSNLLQWEAMRHFRERGVRHYDFFGGRVDPEAGSKVEGIMKFKERFGGPFRQGYAWKMAFRPAAYSIYSLAARLRNGGDLVDQERKRRTDRQVVASLGPSGRPAL